MTGVSPILVALITALPAALVAWLVAVRRFSGKIESSDAAQLWKESADIREWSRERIERQSDRIVSLEGRLATLERANNDLVRENLQLMKESKLLRDVNMALREEVTDLAGQLETCRMKITELEGAVGG